MKKKIFYEDIKKTEIKNINYKEIFTNMASNITNYNVFHGDLYKNDKIKEIESSLEVIPVINCNHYYNVYSNLSLMAVELDLFNYKLCHKNEAEKSKVFNAVLEHAKCKDGNRLYIFHDLFFEIEYHYNKKRLLVQHGDMKKKIVLYEDIIEITEEEMKKEIVLYQDIVQEKNSIYYDYSGTFEKTNHLVLKKLKNIRPYIEMKHLKIQENTLELLEDSLKKYDIVFEHKDYEKLPTQLSAKIYHVVDGMGEKRFVFQDMMYSINYKERNELDDKIYLKKIFKDEVNPTEDELIDWAYSGLNVPWDQDFELVLAEFKLIPTLEKLMDDKKTVNKHDFFRLVLYIISGQALKPNAKEISKRENFFKIIDSIPEGKMSSEFKLWKDRTFYLSENPKSYRKEDWDIGSIFLKEVYDPFDRLDK